MAFGERADLIQDFTRDRQLLTDRIATVNDGVAARVGQVWDIDEAVYQAAAHLARASSPYARRLIIAVTFNGACQEVSKGHTRIEAIEQLFESGSVVFGLYTWDDIAAIRIQNKLAKPDKFDKYNPADFILRKVTHEKPYQPRDVIGDYARETGGCVSLAASPRFERWPPRRSPAELAAEKLEFAKAIDHLRASYSLAYVSSNQKRDGKFRKIQLRVSPEVEKRKGKMDIITRRGYYARRKETTPTTGPAKLPPSTDKIIDDLE
jgi:hypothetical protein